MASLGDIFRTWVLNQHPEGAVPVALDHNHLRIVTPHATAEVNLYPYGISEIVEYRIVRTTDDETVFFLHFMLDDMERAEELFSQMCDALKTEASRQTTHVLLCCTSALTTSMFAAKMNEIAQGLSLDYDFTARSVALALGAQQEYAAILLAPQVAHLRGEMMSAHPNAIVFEIPAKIFGSYDAAGAIRLLMHALQDGNIPSTSDETTMLRAVRDHDNHYRILIITLFLIRDHARLGYRIYDRGLPAGQGYVIKQRLDFRDVEDLVQTLIARDRGIRVFNAIGIAVPGVARQGVVSLPRIIEGQHDLGGVLTKRFGMPVYVDNNCNAAAAGCYVSQDQYESLVFFRQAFGHIAGGFGTIIDGRLLKGRGNLAGEPKYFEKRFSYDRSYDDARWTEKGLQLIAKNVLLAAISLIAPEAVFLSVDTIDDADEFRASLAADLDEGLAPPVFVVSDYVERVYLGELALCLMKLRDPSYRSLGIGS